MKLLFKSTTTVSLMLSAIHINAAPGAETNSPSMVYPPGIVWAAETNGSRAGIVFQPHPIDKSPTALVYFQLASETPVDLSLIPKNTVRRMVGDGRYCMATNGVCGPMELRDSRGRKLPLRNPEVNSPEAYPASYDLIHVYTHAYRGWLLYGPVGPPYGMSSRTPKTILLSNYFNIRDPGMYQLTVWPKIYRRTDTNTDICLRIDLVPVTGTFEYRPGPTR